MNIWLITIGEPLPNSENKKLRTSLLADKLVESGHHIIFFVSAFDHQQKQWIYQKDTNVKIRDNYCMQVLKGIGYQKNISLQRFIDHRILSRKFRKIANTLAKPDIIVTSIPPHDLAYQAVMFAKKNKIPVLADVRDEWPDIFLQPIPQIFHGIAKIILFPEFQMIKKVMSESDGLISMMDGLMKWGLNYAQRKKTWRDKIFYLGCSKAVQSKTSSDKTSAFSDTIKDKFVITFIGTFVKNNNPSILIECARKLVEKNVCFVLVGEGELFSKLKESGSDLPNVIFTGWCNQNEIANYLANSHVGISPTEKVREAFPNKIFTYLSAGLPIITAFEGDLKELVKKYQIGFYYPPNDVNELSNCIMKLHKDQTLYKTMSENAKKVFDELFDANKIYSEYANHIERVAKERINNNR